MTKIQMKTGSSSLFLLHNGVRQRHATWLLWASVPWFFVLTAKNLADIAALKAIILFLKNWAQLQGVDRVTQSQWVAKSEIVTFREFWKSVRSKGNVAHLAWLVSLTLPLCGSLGILGVEENCWIPMAAQLQARASRDNPWSGNLAGSETRCP